MSVGDSAAGATAGANEADGAPVVVPVGGWAILPPLVDDWATLAEALNAPGEPAVYVDSSAA
ncbi:hypothetical protein OG762_52250 (plasmid) [Streptomyces sp. NBC_01136]|uniref:hypothetical protein n=1 Tax=unclassified Streptomyces TaxID=2593676 RepID=UPI002F911C0B|nr:hypothetical protein OG762_52250 [Streptomyces sp. NBC_01136]